MLFLLDTNAISGLMKEDHALSAWLRTLRPEDRLFTCTIVRGEILFGIRRLPAGRRRSDLEAKALRLFDSFPCEPVPSTAADSYATTKMAQQARGLCLDENDLWIAATALALNATLVSRDSDFGRVDELAILVL